MNIGQVNIAYISATTAMTFIDFGGAVYLDSVIGTSRFGQYFFITTLVNWLSVAIRPVFPKSNKTNWQ